MTKEEPCTTTYDFSELKEWDMTRKIRLLEYLNGVVSITSLNKDEQHFCALILATRLKDNPRFVPEELDPLQWV